MGKCRSRPYEGTGDNGCGDDASQAFAGTYFSQHLNHFPFRGGLRLRGLICPAVDCYTKRYIETLIACPRPSQLLHIGRKSRTRDGSVQLSLYWLRPSSAVSSREMMVHASVRDSSAFRGLMRDRLPDEVTQLLDIRVSWGQCPQRSWTERGRPPSHRCA